MSCESMCYAPRSFLTKEEKIEMLQEYKEGLDKESQAVSEKIRDLQKNN